MSHYDVVIIGGGPGGVEQRLTGGHTGNDFLNFLSPLHLQTIGCIVTEIINAKMLIEQFFQFNIIHSV